MEKQLNKYMPTISHKVWAWNDTLSEHDLLAYIEGDLSLEDTKKIEKILFAEDNDFYLDILANLKQRYMTHQGNIQAVLDELDNEAERVSFFQPEVSVSQKQKLRKGKQTIEQKLDKIQKRKNAQNGFQKEKLEKAVLPIFIEQRADETELFESKGRVFISLPLSALSKFFGQFLP